MSRNFAITQNWQRVDHMQLPALNIKNCTAKITDKLLHWRNTAIHCSYRKEPNPKKENKLGNIIWVGFKHPQKWRKTTLKPTLVL